MKLLENLNKQQKEAVCHIQGPLLVVAGAGTGKTKVITHRISHLIEKGIEPNKILAVTFTNKAAEEMRERIVKNTEFTLRSFSEGGPTIGTFHGIAADILRNHGNHIGIPNYFPILDEQKSLDIIKSSIEELNLDQRQFRPNLIQNLISQQKSTSSKPDFDTLNSTSIDAFFPKNLNLIRKEYEERLKKQEALDFDDLIQKTIFLFEQKPEILKIYQEKWPYIHIDEYQDTDSSQHHLVHLLSQLHNNICAVGDDDQSIYGFRGADFTNILNFEKTWPDAKIITLERNYRSTQKILDAANAVISKNTERRDKNLFTREKSGTKLIALEADDEKKEADFVAKTIENLPDKNFSSIAVLCRANFQFPSFEESFLRHSLHYQTASKQDDLPAGRHGLERECQTIRLMTIHAAKGLEFKYVFIPGLEKGLFPYAPSEEERRLFYVALTRSQKKIFLSCARYRNVFGSKQINQPSQFLSEIPKNLIKWL